MDERTDYFDEREFESTKRSEISSLDSVSGMKKTKHRSRSPHQKHHHNPIITSIFVQSDEGFVPASELFLILNTACLCSLEFLYDDG
ncbi:unnamed protein product [Onchocerca flexuosa]|uniref:Ovule protein n=1 Tax=Onchocerca flexuosa TaxID=387005 RepID=A0A183HDR1_9BILA|nr:unnamed protein product [Onchocerca flexuosa]